MKWVELATGETNLHHDDFFTHSLAKSYYKRWMSTILTRVNTVTGVAYCDEPAILSWELINEPRCSGSGYYPSTNNCTVTTTDDDGVPGENPVAWKITAWVDEMSTYFKTLDKNHMLGVGDEGFFCDGPATCANHDFTCDCDCGTDFDRFVALPGIDYGSFHLYPEAWGQGGGSGAVTWGSAWISNHTGRAHALGKPAVLGEFGATTYIAQAAAPHAAPPRGPPSAAAWAVVRAAPREARPSPGAHSAGPTSQSDAYQAWTEAADAADLDGVHFWMLCGAEPGGGDSGWYPNYDGFCVYCPLPSDSTPPPSNADAASCGVLASAASSRA
jgi:mannan endo-1,4-beta-mannosidase